MRKIRKRLADRRDFIPYEVALKSTSNDARHNRNFGLGSHCQNLSEDTGSTLINTELVGD